MVWTQFYDMHSGGSKKLDWETIYIETSKNIAEEYFEVKFGRSPFNISCDCCGPDYSVSECDPNSGSDQGREVLIISRDELPPEVQVQIVIEE